MRGSTLLSLVVLCAGCGSAASSRGSTTERTRVDVETAEVAGGVINLQLNREAAITALSVAASPEAVWSALPQVFAELEIPVTGIRTEAKVLTATGHRLRRIGGRGMATYFDCPGAYENLAASSDVYFSVQTQVLPDSGEDGSVVRTRVDGSARSSRSGSQVLCSSRGSLETLILLRLSEKVAALD
jgi:hypothetical protein